MKETKKYLMRILVSLFLAVLVGVGLLFPQKAYAGNAARAAWRDENGNILIQVQEKKISGTIGYRTIGWTITRCPLGTMEHTEDQYFTIKRPEGEGAYTQVQVGNQVVTCFVISEADILARIAAVDPGWLADIQSGELCYVMFDAIMVTFDNREEEDAKFSGYLNSETNQDYKENGLNLKPGVYDKFTYEELMNNTYAWADPSGIARRYDVPVLWNGGEIPEPEINDEYVTTIGKKKPEY